MFTSMEIQINDQQARIKIIFTLPIDDRNEDI
jgi:hypothetical protein